MTERDITGDATRSQYRKAMKIADRAELTDEELRVIADGVREFDAQRSPELRTVAALETLAKNTTPDRDRENSWAWEDRRLRKREVAAKELSALALLADDEDVEKIKAGALYRRLFERVTSQLDAPT